MYYLVFSALQKPNDYVLDSVCTIVLDSSSWDLATLDMFACHILASSEKGEGILTHSISSYRIGVSSYLMIRFPLF